MPSTRSFSRHGRGRPLEAGSWAGLPRRDQARSNGGFGSRRGHFASLCRGILAIVALLVVLPFCASSLGAEPAQAHEPAPAREAAKSPPKIQEFLDLLGDPQVRAWLEQHAKTGSPGTNQPRPAPEADSAGFTVFLSDKLKSIREYVVALAAALPKMGGEFEHAKFIFEQEYDSYGRLWIVLLVGSFLLLGFVVEWVFRLVSRPLRRKAASGAALDDVGERVRTVVVRFLLGVGLVTSFALGSVGVFLAVEWPDLLKEILLRYLLAFLVIRLTIVTGRFLLSPPGKADPLAARFRLVPVNDAGARFWYRSVVAAVAWWALGSATVQLLRTFGFSDLSLTILYDGLMLGLTLIGIVSIWRAPPSFYEPSRFIQRWGHRTIATFDTALLLVVWLLWVADFPGGFALLLVIFGMPTVIAVAQRSINHILRPPGAEHDDAKPRTVQAVVLERGVRALLIAGAAYLLGRAWGIDLASLTMQDTFFTRILRDILNGVVIFLVADLVWHVIAVVIDNQLAEIGPGGPDAVHDTEKHARQRTLLPILRNVLFITLLVITGMMLLAGMGVAVGPLIASAGVLGVAIGFGSQTLVRDIISGVFYLFDDAFRVGEYIQSGSYKGTVESFSLRSIKLRHHRGPLYTVPFGSLGAVQNMSRDWTVEKMTIGVAYDTDVARVKRLVKQVGKTLLEDPELAPSIIETLKLQGIESFGDYAIQLRVKIMTKAGEQFTVKRRALALIKTTFDENGISFALPMVQVSEPKAAAAAHHGVERTRNAAMAAAANDEPKSGTRDESRPKEPSHIHEEIAGH